MPERQETRIGRDARPIADNGERVGRDYRPYLDERGRLVIPRPNRDSGRRTRGSARNATASSSTANASSGRGNASSTRGNTRSGRGGANSSRGRGAWTRSRRRSGNERQRRGREEEPAPVNNDASEDPDEDAASSRESSIGPPGTEYRGEALPAYAEEPDDAHREALDVLMSMTAEDQIQHFADMARGAGEHFGVGEEEDELEEEEEEEQENAVARVGHRATHAVERVFAHPGQALRRVAHPHNRGVNPLDLFGEFVAIDPVRWGLHLDAHPEQRATYEAALQQRQQQRQPATQAASTAAAPNGVGDNRSSNSGQNHQHLAHRPRQTPQPQQHPPATGLNATLSRWTAHYEGLPGNNSDHDSNGT